VFVRLWLIELKIHVSPDTKEILDTFKTFQLELRGPVEMKVQRTSFAADSLWRIVSQPVHINELN